MVPSIESVLVHTGQHFDEEMSAVFFDELDMPQPDLNLGINSGLHGQMTGRMVQALESVVVETAPDWGSCLRRYELDACCRDCFVKIARSYRTYRSRLTFVQPGDAGRDQPGHCRSSESRVLHSDSGRR